MSRSQHPRHSFVRAEGEAIVPLHVIPYRVEWCISGRHLVGASLSTWQA
jgi:hypothetical protein